MTSSPSRRVLLAALTATALAPAATARAAWTAPEALAMGGDDISLPQVAMNPEGDAVVAYSDDTDGQLGVQVRPAGGAWSAPSELTTTAGGLGRFSLAIAPDRELALVAFSEGGVVKVAEHAAGGGWTVQSLGSGDQPAVALTTGGKAIMFWIAGSSAYAATRASDGTWTVTPVTSAPGAQDVGAAIAPGGSALATWTSGGSTYAAAFDGMSWSAPTAFDGESPRLAVAPDGTFTLADTGLADASMQVRTYDPGSGWSAPATLLSTSGGTRYTRPALSVAADGGASLTWVDDATGADVRWVATRDAAGTWSPPVQLPATATGTPATAARPGGHAAVAWRDTAGPTDLDAALFDGSTIGAENVLTPGSSTTTEPALGGDGTGDAVIAFGVDSGGLDSTILDETAPALSALDVPASGTAGTPVAASVEVDDPLAGPGATTWDFGDGTAAETGTSVTHTYAQAGSYTIDLKAYDNVGNLSEHTASIVVSAVPAVPHHLVPGTPAPATTPEPATLEDPATTSVPAPTTHAETTPSAATPAVPAPPRRHAAPAPVLDLAHHQRHVTVLTRRAIATRVTAPGAGSVVVTARVSDAVRRALHLRSARIAFRRGTVLAGQPLAVRLHLGPVLRGRVATMPSLDATVSVLFTAADGTRSITRTRLTIKA